MHRNRQEEYERLCAENEAAEKHARRTERVYWIVTLLVCWAWCLLGGFITAYGFHIVDPVNGPILRDAGVGIAAGGTLITVFAASLHRRRRGYD
jgi:hypothetical protein